MRENYGASANSAHYRFLSLGRNYKKVIMVFADLMMLPLALWSGFALRLAEWWPIAYMEKAWVLFVATPLLGVVIFMKLGLYRAVVRFMGAQAILSVCKGVLALAVILWAGAIFLQVEPFPRSVPVNFALAALVYVGGSRLIVRTYYHWLLKHYVDKERVLIYGAGGAGVQLASAIGTGAEFLPIGFLDDDKALWKSTVNGLPVYDPRTLAKLIEKYGVTYVLLALPSISQQQRRLILENLSDYPVHVKTVPNMPEMISGVVAESLREVEPEDLLGRDEVPPDPSLVSKSITGKVVFVSGAGGSIGSEICRQVLKNTPRSLVLYEISEYALYTIEKELSQNLGSVEGGGKIYPILGSVLDRERVNRVLEKFGVDTIYHAAAYKHVPMVEHNVIEGIRNNAIGTKILAETALEQDVERFVLVSTDKAVRPTNVMGASKRLAELILQDLAVNRSTTVFSMVRFGNVLGSSGSVVPLFREQINKGGPVTVTHPEITRFFMTIPEAASLVIQAGSMASGGDVFVLDMGQPVKILDLATRMIRLMGYELREGTSKQGIEISFSGLRPGEKLYEELLIGDDVVGTEHVKIMRAHEVGVPADLLEKKLKSLEAAMANGDSELARKVLRQLVTEFQPSSPLVDLLGGMNSAEPSFH